MNAIEATEAGGAEFTETGANVQVTGEVAAQPASVEIVDQAPEAAPVKPRRPHRRTRPLYGAEAPAASAQPDDSNLPQPPAYLVSIAQSRRATEARRLNADLDRVDCEMVSRTERIRASAGSVADVQRVTEQMAQVRADRERRLAAIGAMSPRQLVLEYVKESGWTG
jgi:hypothetical protein